MKVLFIDNFDSFTYNLVDEFKALKCEIMIYRNDISIEQLGKILNNFLPDLIVLSPGPSHPKDAGICNDLIKYYHKQFPILGICLGHQCLIDALGGKVEKLEMPVHGKKSAILHSNSKILYNLPNPFFAGRYHSLYGSVVPPYFKITATANEVPMAIENYQYNLFGLQFHPESILTAEGSKIIENIITLLK